MRTTALGEETQRADEERLKTTALEEQTRREEEVQLRTAAKQRATAVRWEAGENEDSGHSGSN